MDSLAYRHLDEMDGEMENQTDWNKNKTTKKRRQKGNPKFHSPYIFKDIKQNAVTVFICIKYKINYLKCIPCSSLTNSPPYIACMLSCTAHFLPWWHGHHAYNFSAFSPPPIPGKRRVALRVQIQAVQLVRSAISSLHSPPAVLSFSCSSPPFPQSQFLPSFVGLPFTNPLTSCE